METSDIGWAPLSSTAPPFRTSVRMCRLGFLVLFSTLALSLVLASAAIAAPGCDAPPDTAATDQYCETLVAPQGSQDVTQPPSHPLGSTLRRPVASELGRAGVLGDVLMAMQTGTLVASSDVKAGLASPARAAAARRAEFDPRVNALTPGPADSAASTIAAAAATGASTIHAGFGLALVLILIFLAGCSLGTRNLGRGSER
jgi:hypothetical protein